MNNKKVKRIAAEIAIVLVLLVGFIVINEQIRQNRENSFKPITDNNMFAYQIDEITIEEQDLVIRGWFFELKKYRNTERETHARNKLGILLYNIDNEFEKDLAGYIKPQMGVSMRVDFFERSDVNEYFKCEYDYSSCGFEARIEKSNLDLMNEVYQIIFKPDYEKTDGILSNTYIDKGKLCYVNPQKKIQIEVLGTDLEKVVNNGVCVASNKDNKIAIYQYNWKLYWIAEKGYNFDEDGSTYIQYQIGTTQFHKLPSGRTDNGWYWDNIGTDFENNEITNTMNCGEYRVYVRDIPIDYSVTGIETGYYNNGKWEWYEFVRPRYSF